MLVCVDMNSIRNVTNFARWVIITSALTPLIVVAALPFPYVFGKMVFLYTLVEIAFVVLVGLGLYDLFGGKSGISWRRLLHPLAVMMGLFLLSTAVSTLFAVNPFRAFWSTIERAEGLFGMIHYVALFAAFVLLFRKREWKIFFIISIVVGAITSLFALAQSFGIETFSFLGFDSRPGSFLGNPTFLATYLVLLLGMVGMLVRKRFVDVSIALPVRICAGVAGILFLITIFVTQTRGALVGLVAGVLVGLIVWGLLSRNTRVRKGVVVALIVAIVGGGIFFATRTADIWQSIPGLSRISDISLEDATVQTRLISLGSSLSAFVERPVFGWGPENFNIAYNKYYNPDYAQYEDRWFDRAHNKIADVGVMQGVFGLLVYLGMFVVLGYTLLRRKGKTFFDPSTRSVFVGVFVAYFVQNLFVFDQITSYLFFFALLGFVVYGRYMDGEEVVMPNRRAMNVAVFGWIVVALLVGLSWYVFIATPVTQGVSYTRALETRVGEKILDASDSFLAPYNYTQSTIRGMFVKTLYDGQVFRNGQFLSLINVSLGALEEVVYREPYDPRFHIQVSEAYTEKSKIDGGYYYYDVALEYVSEGLSLSPQRQSLQYQYNFLLAGLGRYGEAIEGAENVVASNVDIARAHYQLALILAVVADEPGHADQKMHLRERAEQELGVAEELDFKLLNESDLNNIIVLYRAWGKLEKSDAVLAKIVRYYPKEENLWLALDIYRVLQNKDRVIQAARKLVDINPTLKDSMDVVIDLAEKERWDILMTL